MAKLVIGLDFGSDSARAVLVDCADGRVLASSSMNYPRWSEGRFCNSARSCWRQSPLDYIEVLKHIVPEVVAGADSASDIVAIGVDTTASTPCLLDKDFKFISDEDPDAQFVLWKDHTAIAESEEITAMAGKYLSHSGGIYSAENFWSKVLHIVRTNHFVASKAHFAIEQCDFITYTLTGVLRASRCAAACKQMWDSGSHFPPVEFFASLDPVLGRIASNMPGDTYLSQDVCGLLSPEWAGIFGLGEDVVVSVGNIDAHSGAVGAGCSPSGIVLNLGTSACIMAVGPHQAPVSGVFAQAEDIIMPGLDGYEMGLSSFGDNFAWVSRLTGRSIAELSESASYIAEPDCLPLCTDWLNGRRTPYPNPNAKATITDVTMSTGAVELFWSIVEASCFGIRAIVDHLAEHNVKSERLVAIGGVSRKSPFVMQMLSDTLGRDIEVSSAAESCALGASMNAAVAAGLFEDLPSAQAAMLQPALVAYHPKSQIHESRYLKYRELY